MTKQETKTHATRESLTGKVAVVTGASRGIGLAVAKVLIAEHCSLVATSRSVGQLPKKPLQDLLCIACDVRDERAVAQLFAAVKKQFGRVDILVNNAGMAHSMRNVEDMPLDVWREVIDTNLTGMFLCTRAALPLMGKGGVIVNNLSVAARGVFPGESAYCASKHGALGFTETLREEVRGRGIRVISLLPGPTRTDIWKQFWPDAPREKMMSPETVARALLAAITLPENATVEELRIGPTTGNL
jgi:NAD(P)-dependent dehydrogenase (short-subunit alcohol dehydrogenase family)